MDPNVVLPASGSVGSVVFKEKSNANGAFNSLDKGSVDASIADGVMPKVEETQASSDSIVGERTQFQMSGQALQGRADYRGRGRISNQENEEWRKKLAGTSTSVMSSKRIVDAQLGSYTQDQCNFKEVSKKEDSNPSDNTGTEPYVTCSVDVTNYKAQRAKVKVLATQRARQIWDPGGWVDAITTADTTSLEVAGSPTKATLYVHVAVRRLPLLAGYGR